MLAKYTTSLDNPGPTVVFERSKDPGAGAGVGAGARLTRLAGAGVGAGVGAGAGAGVSHDSINDADAPLGLVFFLYRCC